MNNNNNNNKNSSTSNTPHNDYTSIPTKMEIQSHGDCFYEFVLSPKQMLFLQFSAELFELTKSEIMQTMAGFGMDKTLLPVWQLNVSMTNTFAFTTISRIHYEQDLSAKEFGKGCEDFIINALMRMLIQFVKNAFENQKESFMDIAFNAVDCAKLGLVFCSPAYFETVLTAAFNKYVAQFDLATEPEHIFVKIPKPNYNLSILVDFPDGSENYLNKKFLVDRQILTIEKEDERHSFVKFEDFNIAEFSDRFKPSRSMDKSFIEKTRECEEWRYRGMTIAQKNDHDVSNELLSYTSDRMYKRIRIKGADYKKAFHYTFPSGKTAISPKDEDMVEIYQVSYGPITTRILD